MIEPGKRPRITLSPTIVLDNNEKAILAISVAGGDNQDQMTLQLLIGQIDFGLDFHSNLPVTSPRFMSDHFISSFGQKPPVLGQLRVNPELGRETLDALRKLGHKLLVRQGPLSAAPSVIQISSGDRSQINASGDPRAGRHAMAY